MRYINLMSLTSVYLKLFLLQSLTNYRTREV